MFVTPVPDLDAVVFQYFFLEFGTPFLCLAKMCLSLCNMLSCRACRRPSRPLSTQDNSGRSSASRAITCLPSPEEVEKVLDLGPVSPVMAAPTVTIPASTAIPTRIKLIPARDSEDMRKLAGNSLFCNIGYRNTSVDGEPECLEEYVWASRVPGGPLTKLAEEAIAAGWLEVHMLRSDLVPLSFRYD